MNNLSKSIDILFRKISVEKIFDVCFDQLQFWTLSEKIDANTYRDLLWYAQDDRSTGDEIDIDYQTLTDCWLKRPHTGDSDAPQSVFNLLIHLGKDLLQEKNGEPLCTYRRLLAWNEISRRLGEDILTTSHLAYTDSISSKERHFFAWRPIISSTNNRLQNLLSRGIAENHFHLKGSAPYFDLSWLSLMNNITRRGEDFQRFQKDTRLEPELITDFKEKHTTLYPLVQKAAFIRLLLFAFLTPSQLPRTGILRDKRINLLKTKNENELAMHLVTLQAEIDFFKWEYARTFDGKPADYAIPKNTTEANFNGNILLTGERRFLYLMFKELYREKKETPHQYKELFYAYLVIKEKLRQEMVQVNQRIGFKNFQRYQDRKEYFIKKGSIYEKGLTAMAVQTSVTNQAIQSFETRIAPQQTSWQTAETIRTIDRDATTLMFSNSRSQTLDQHLRHIENPEDKTTPEPQYRHFYTLHFIKTREKKSPARPSLWDAIIPRDSHCRKTVKQLAHAIVNLRNGLRPSASRIYGIDAASSEIGCRPEVFAQAYRFLKNHSLDGRYDHLKTVGDHHIVKLGATYHVGEDFLDIIDGLRAVDEAIRFLKLSHGDRIGHGLALGIDARDYYELKKFKIYLPGQDLLDNIVWMLSRIRSYHLEDCSDLEQELESKYITLFARIYGNHGLEQMPYPLYFEAWKLRGDAPEKYLTNNPDRKAQLFTFWDRCGWNDEFPENDSLRDTKGITRLYHSYHFSPEVKKSGSKIEEFKISNKYIRAVESIQVRLQQEVCERGIGIETNPSSNYLIGSFATYDKHPIVRFFNLGLTVDPEAIQQCPQLFVSINTDDQGVFNTYLEKEYELLALALEKAEDENGNKRYKQAMIYDWLDRIRQMGLEQRFKK